MLNVTAIQRYVLPTPMLQVYCSVSFIALILCFVAFIATLRTRKLPYSSKLLSLGLLFYDVLFLLTAGLIKLVDFEEMIFLQHLSRGFQVASQLIVLFMALERLFVLNWPYVYLRVATMERTRSFCFVIIILSFLQYVAVRVTLCYDGYVTKIFSSRTGMTIYMMVISVLSLLISFISYFQIFRIIIRKGAVQGHRFAITQYKGTMTSFMYLLNTAVTQLINSGILAFAVVNKHNIASGYYPALADTTFIFNCILDPLIYVVWFKETRLEILNMLKVVCPFLKPAAERLRMEVFGISYIKDDE